MDSSELTPEQQQLTVEIDTVLNSIEAQSDPGKKSYEVEQGRKLIEKAIKINLPERSYADLQKHVSSGETSA